MTVQVTRATPDRVPNLAMLLGRAFSDDQIVTWPLTSDASEEQIRLFFLWFDERACGAQKLRFGA